MDEKLDIIGKEYDIPLEENFRKDMSTMCNLSQGVKEEGIAIGRAEGEAGLIAKMYKNGLSIELIASATDKTIEEVKTIIEEKKIPRGLRLLPEKTAGCVIHVYTFLRFYEMIIE